MSRHLAFPLAAACLALHAAAPVAAQVNQVGNKVTADSVAAGDSAAARARPPRPPAAIYDSVRPLELSLVTDLRGLRRDRFGDPQWRGAALTWAEAGGATRTVPVRVRARGIWRRRNCELPPLRLDFAAKAVEGTPFQHLDRPKLVGYCENTKLFEQYVLQEFQLYRIYNLLTPLSHRVRLLRLAYVDSASGKTQTTRWAFLVEEPEALARRVGGVRIELKGATPDDLDPHTSAVMGVFQYLIGNTDWSIAGLHNAELLGLNGTYHPVAYDFDYAGAVNATYAVPDAKLPIRRVRDRLFRGYCVPEEEYQRAFALFTERREAIYNLYRDEIGQLLDKEVTRRTLEYFDEFYRIITDPRSAKRNIVDSCLGRR